MKRFLSLRATAYAGAIGCLLVLGCFSSDPEPPNLLLYVVDTLRVDAVGGFGGEDARTPNFHSLAAAGVQFENAYSSSSWTRASMASILTGLHPPRHRARRASSKISPDSFFGFDRGFDAMLELYWRKEDGKVETKRRAPASARSTAAAKRWLSEAPRPFVLTLLSIDPHAPYDPRFAA